MFNNLIEETETNNVITNEYIYNGAGVGVADFNGNGYPDIFFAGNEVSNKLYINEGDFRFTDVTEEANVSGNNDKWYSGVSIVDINNNGLPDIYLSVTGQNDSELRRNELYINQGLNDNGVPFFIEMAKEYGIDDPSYTTHAAFFDSDNNGRLDLYLLVAYGGGDVSYTDILAQDDSNRLANTDKLFRSEWDEEKGHPVFRDVSEEAGIAKPGYGLGVSIVDINQNGYKDIYVANDYISNDLFWINNGDGTFTDQASTLFKHTSYSAMGTDIADLSNNGLPDIYTLDMLPEINVRRKMMANPNNYRNFINQAFEGYDPQYTRNTLQYNLGAADSTNMPIFSEIALFSGVAWTDWSWAPLLADLNNDGYRDIFVTNGIPRDITDKDFWNEYARVRNIMPMRLALPMIPQVEIPNYLFRNNGDLTFSDNTNEWGFGENTYSTGAVYADLNNNGALDLIINNTNQEAFIYRNRTPEIDDFQNNNWLKVKVKGDYTNTMGLGAIFDLYFDENQHQKHEHTIYRGYLSSVDPVAHFGVGAVSVIDSLIISWANGDTKKQLVFENIEVNQTIIADYSEADFINTGNIYSENRTYQEPIFRDVTEERGVNYQHIKSGFNDFNRQPLLPHKLSQFGPAVTSADITGNGLDDLFIGATFNQPSVILFQNEDGSFDEVEFNPVNEEIHPEKEHGGALLFDADGNGFPDLYLAGGGVIHEPGHEHYRDRFYRNNGDGTFTYLPDAIPEILVSGSVVIQSDFTGNGLYDLFVGGKVEPGKYPKPVSSFLLKNVSDESGIRFEDVTSEAAPMLHEMGIVNDAIWSDFTGNGTDDLIIAGDWMPVTFLENRGGSFVDITAETGLSDETGWWNTITAADVNGNGYPDYIVGNLGLNSLYKASHDYPVSIYYGDLTGDGFFESIPTIFIKDEDGQMKEFPAHNREEFMRQMPGLISEFPTHESYGRATIEELLGDGLLENATVKRATNFKSSVLLNDGNGRFNLEPLPDDAQLSPIFGILSEDITKNGKTDLLITGNLSGADLQIGSYNGLNGLLLMRKEDGELKPISLKNSGFLIPGFGRSITNIKSTGHSLITVVQWNGELRMFQIND